MGVLTILVAFEYYLFKNNFLMNTVEQMLKLYMYAHFHLVYWSQFSFSFFLAYLLVSYIEVIFLCLAT